MQNDLQFELLRNPLLQVIALAELFGCLAYLLLEPL